MHTRARWCGVRVARGGWVRLFFGGGLWLLGQAADGQVVYHLLDLLHVVLEAVVALVQRVVLQVEQAEAQVQLVDDGGDAQGAAVVARRHAVDRQPRLDRNTGRQKRSEDAGIREYY